MEVSERLDISFFVRPREFGLDLLKLLHFYSVKVGMTQHTLQNHLKRAPHVAVSVEHQSSLTDCQRNLNRIVFVIRNHKVN